MAQILSNRGYLKWFFWQAVFLLRVFEIALVRVKEAYPLVQACSQLSLHPLTDRIPLKIPRLFPGSQVWDIQ